MLESLFHKVAGLQACNYIKKRLQQKCFLANIAKNFKNTYFKKHLRTAASKPGFFKNYNFTQVVKNNSE